MDHRRCHGPSMSLQRHGGLPYRERALYSAHPIAGPHGIGVQYLEALVAPGETMAPWDPDCYLTYQKERFAPFEDLLPMIRVRPGLRAVDLGCGTGELTLRLAEWLPDSHVIGIDTSEEMLAKARELERPGLRFEHRDLRALEGQWDLIFSHAAIHWAEDHRELIPRLLSCAAPGGHDGPPNEGPPHLALPRDRALSDREAPGQRWPRPLLRGKR
ncbi:MAG: hypothetical protein B7X11_03400 [Acidobacteria bacterium 37-65-4]|nr:MAG: hypothetical protein B7X11_03400 [Acidobacteria bacterium 37-65-4]